MAIRADFLGAAFLALVVPAQAAPSCHCARDWALHRPSTKAERAETARLNRAFRAARQSSASQSSAPPQRTAENAPPPAPHRSQVEEYRDLRAAYEHQLEAYYRAFPPARAAENSPPPQRSQFEEYRDLRAAYERQLRLYYRAFPPLDQNYAYAGPPVALGPGAQTRRQDTNRMAPWHAYNPYDGPTNGY
jgi:hypothetical protein